MIDGSTGSGIDYDNDTYWRDILSVPNLDLYPVEKNAPGEQPGGDTENPEKPGNGTDKPEKPSTPAKPSDSGSATPKPQGPVNPGDNGSSGTGNHKNKNKNSKQSSVETGMSPTHDSVGDRHAGCTGRSGYHYSAPQTEKQRPSHEGGAAFS